MSELLETVQHHRWLAETHRIDPYVFCHVNFGTGDFWFSVFDDGWYGWFIAQYPRAFEGKAFDEASLLLRLVKRDHPLFRFDINEKSCVVRAVFQLPIANELRAEDDVKAAIGMLDDEWGTLLPFLDRVADGEEAEAVAIDAVAAFEALDERTGRDRVRPPAVLNGGS